MRRASPTAAADRLGEHAEQRAAQADLAGLAAWGSAQSGGFAPARPDGAVAARSRGAGAGIPPARLRLRRAPDVAAQSGCQAGATGPLLRRGGGRDRAARADLAGPLVVRLAARARRAQTPASRPPNVGGAAARPRAVWRGEDRY